MFSLWRLYAEGLISPIPTKHVFICQDFQHSRQRESSNSIEIKLFWDCLKKRDLQTWESVKATFLKRALKVSKFTPSRLVYILAKETLLIEHLRFTYIHRRLCCSTRGKEKEIWSGFYCTGTMIDRHWTGHNQELRHVVTPLAVHGFHHKVCSNNCFHVSNVYCVCS